jgi:hypothetical protein
MNVVNSSGTVYIQPTLWLLSNDMSVIQVLDDNQQENYSTMVQQAIDRNWTPLLIERGNTQAIRFLEESGYRPIAAMGNEGSVRRGIIPAFAFGYGFAAYQKQ